MFLNDDRLVFSLLVILFTFSRFVFCFCDSVSSWLLGSVHLEVWCFHFPKLAVLFRWIVFVWHNLMYMILYLWVYHTSVSWWSSTGVWATENLLKSPGLFPVFCPILIIPVIWMVSTCVLIYNPSNPFNNPFVTVPSALIKIGIIVTFMFHSFFQFPRKA